MKSYLETTTLTAGNECLALDIYEHIIVFSSQAYRSLLDEPLTRCFYEMNVMDFLLSSFICVALIPCIHTNISA